MPVYLLGSQRLHGCKYGFSATMDGVYECLNDARRFCVDYQLLDVIPEGTVQDESAIKHRGRKSGFHLGREQFAWVSEIVTIFKDYKMELGQQGTLDFDVCGCTTVVSIAPEPVAVEVHIVPRIEEEPTTPEPSVEPSEMPAIREFVPRALPNGKKVRFTPDGQHITVFDAIASAGYKNPRDVWARMLRVFPELVEKCDKFRSAGRGQRFVDVTDRSGYLYLMAKLPGRRGQQTLETLIETTLRVWDNDITLIESMVEKIDNPVDAKRVAVRAEGKKRHLLAKDRIAACGGRGDRKPNVFAAVNGNHNRTVTGHTAKEIQKAGGLRSTRDNPLVTETYLALFSLADAMLADKLASKPVQGNQAIIALDKRQVCEPILKFRRDNGIADIAV